MADEARDPLSYFAAYGSGSSSSSESDGDSAEDQPPARGPDPGERREAGGGTKEPVAALPAPDELFNSVSRPRFLSNPLREQIDWGRRLVRAPEEPPKEFKIWKTNAVPPPQTYVTEEKKPPPGVDMAVKWSSMYQDNGDDAPNRLPVVSDLLPGELVASESDEEDEAASAKKRKTESFQQKEKRKRNDGQANREKSFVEEEKRILRQDFRLKD